MDEIIFLLILLVFSGIFSGSETALVALSLARAEGLAKEGRSGSQALLHLKKNTTQMLITILIGNNLVNIAAASLATVVATRWFGHMGPGLAVGVLTILILIFGEITPKSMATRNAERISLVVAPPLLLLMRAIFPLVWLFQRLTNLIHQLTGAKSDPTVTESELIHMAGHGAKEGTIENDKKELIEKIFTFGETTVRDVMTPHDQIIALDGKLTVEEALPEVARLHHSRILVFNEDPENIQKVFHLRDLLANVVQGKTDITLNEMSHEAEFVAQYQLIDELFSSLRTKKRHMAVVVDEFGVLRGLVTLEDLMEELFGEIYDESDIASQSINKVSEREIAVNGKTELRDIEDFFGIELSGKPTDSVNLWLLRNIQKIPGKGETFTLEGLEIRVEEATRRLIQRVVLKQKNVAN